MTAQPRVSVVIPCYNAARFLAETLDSVRKQTYADFEIIAVNDGSTDETAGVLRRWSSSVQIVSMANGGVSAARNAGTQRARGEFVHYLDSDDQLMPDALAKCVSALDAGGADVAYSGYRRLEEGADGVFRAGAPIERRIEDVDADPLIAFLTEMWTPPAAMMYRRSIVEKIGGWNNDLPVIQDARFAFDAAQAGARFVYVPGVAALYRVQRRAASLSQRDRLAFARDTLHNAVDIENRWANGACLTRARQAALARVYDFVSRRLLGVDDALFEEALTHLYR
ncbi:MAG TPA: glycosyltransferase, partial [Elusimicrobiota bacterium]|nr:glycosyltransferase [Elusimicrobiota bacterium]